LLVDGRILETQELTDLDPEHCEKGSKKKNVDKIFFQNFSKFLASGSGSRTLLHS
jgi:hypothetical protein